MPKPPRPLPADVIRLIETLIDAGATPPAKLTSDDVGRPLADAEKGLTVAQWHQVTDRFALPRVVPKAKLVRAVVEYIVGRGWWNSQPSSDHPE